MVPDFFMSSNFRSYFKPHQPDLLVLFANYSCRLTRILESTIN